MSFVPLPRAQVKPVVPPIKCQGIKTKLVGFILANIHWDGEGRWIEPFLGSGVVAFTVQPKYAILNDINPHIITFYRRIYDGSLTAGMVREHLTREGQKLFTDEGYYYTVRDRFNQVGDPLDFLFLNRAAFNGLIRFNQKGEFNVPFCRKPDRFRQAYVTKIANQVKTLSEIMRGKEWEFRAMDWRAALADVREEDFVYLDPPYIGRHTDYYERWSERDAAELAEVAQSLPCGFALSMWKQNQYRVNPHIAQHWNGAIERAITHFYHVGATEDLRHAMEEVVLIKSGHASALPASHTEQVQPVQMRLALFDGREAYVIKGDVD